MGGIIMPVNVDDDPAYGKCPAERVNNDVM